MRRIRNPKRRGVGGGVDGGRPDTPDVRVVRIGRDAPEIPAQWCASTVCAHLTRVTLSIESISSKDRGMPDMDSLLIDRQNGAASDARGRQALREKTDQWDAQHRKRADQLAVELLHDMPGAGADERLLARLVAREAALVERLADLEVQLAERAFLLVDNPAHVLKITKALREAAAVSGAMTRRVESLLATASALRMQRLMAPSSSEKRSRLRAA